MLRSTALAILVFFSITSPVFSADLISSDYVRVAGWPKFESATFVGSNPEGKLKIYNGGSDDNYCRVSSAFIFLNSKPVLWAWDLNKKKGYLERAVSLEEANKLSVMVLGKPGCGLTLRVEEANSAPTLDLPTSVSVDEDSSVSIPFSVSDPDADQVTVSIV